MADLGMRDSEPFGETLLCPCTSRIQRADFANLIGSQSLYVEAMLARSVSHVVLLRSQKQVVGIDAKRDIALVENTKSVRNRTDKEFIGHPVGQGHTVPDLELSVSSAPYRVSSFAACSPEPTASVAARRIHFGLKAGFGFRVRDPFIIRLGNNAATLQQSIVAASTHLGLGALVVATNGARRGYTHVVNLLARLAAPGTFAASPGTSICSPNYTAIIGRFGE